MKQAGWEEVQCHQPSPADSPSLDEVLYTRELFLFLGPFGNLATHGVNCGLSGQETHDTIAAALENEACLAEFFDARAAWRKRIPFIVDNMIWGLCSEFPQHVGSTMAGSNRGAVASPDHCNSLRYLHLCIFFCGYMYFYLYVYSIAYSYNICIHILLFNIHIYIHIYMLTPVDTRNCTFCPFTQNSYQATMNDCKSPKLKKSKNLKI